MRSTAIASSALRVGFMTVALSVALAGTAAAQDPSDSSTRPPDTTAPPAAVAAPPQVTPSVNVAQLPIDLARLQRRLRASAERAQQDGQTLKYFVDVYAFAPPLLLFTREDIRGDGANPGGPPMHQQIIDLNTPDEHRGSNTVRKGGINILGGRKK
jgi:hypothetical protein